MVQHAFGLRIRSAFPLPELAAPVESDGVDVDVDIAFASSDVVAAAFSGPSDEPHVRSTILGDGCEYRSERGRSGDYRIGYGDRATFHLSAGGASLRCAPVDVDDPAWRRFLLDTALGTAALLHGYEALHAGAVAGPRGAIAVVGDQGGGKSTLVAQLVGQGYPMVSDDLLFLRAGAQGVEAQPGPPLVNLEPMLPDGTPAAALGQVLATLDGECWIRLRDDQVVDAPVPLAAVVLLDRGDHPAVLLEPVPASTATLLRHSLLSGRAQERMARRFELVSDLVAAVAVVRLRTPVLHPPAGVAAALDELLAPDAVLRTGGS